MLALKTLFVEKKVAVRVPVEEIERRAGAKFFERLPPIVVEQLNALKKSANGGVATLDIQVISKKESDPPLSA